MSKRKLSFGDHGKEFRCYSQSISGSYQEAILCPRGHLAIPGDKNWLNYGVKEKIGTADI